MRRRIAPKALAAVLAVAISLAAAGTAAADSIVYIKDHNVWIAKPDGSGARSVTTDGKSDWPYRSPSQANDGTISAGRGSEVVKLDQQGNILAQFDPPVPAGTASFGASPPQDVAVSPDGSKVAYTFYGYSCLPGASCGTRQMTVYSPSGSANSLGHEFSLTNPEWVTNGSVLGFSGYGNQVNFDQPGSGDYDAKHWFDDGETDLTDGELSKQGDRLALLRNYGSNTHLQIYAVSGFTSAPAKACNTGAEESLHDPTWSPDGKRLAFAHSEGVEVLPLPERGRRRLPERPERKGHPARRLRARLGPRRRAAALRDQRGRRPRPHAREGAQEGPQALASRRTWPEHSAAPSWSRRRRSAWGLPLSSLAAARSPSGSRRGLASASRTGRSWPSS